MFTEITALRYQGLRGNEHVWIPEGSAQPACLLAGALLGSEIIRVRFVRASELTGIRYQLVDDQEGTLPYHSWMVVKGDEQWQTPHLADRVQELLMPYTHGFSFSDTALRLTRPLASQERVYGLGERTGDMNKRGQAFPVWNIDPPVHHSDATRTMYTSIPFYIGLHLESGRAYGVLVDHTGKVEMDIGKSYEDRVSITVEGESLVVYFFAGPTPEAVLRQYSELTGRMPLPARWTLGHHQCRWSYMSEQDVMQLATRLRERHHPCDAVWLDIDYMDGYRNFTWNPTTFPDPALLTQRLHAMGLRLVTILDPGTKVDEEYSIYREGMQKDYFCRYPDGEVFVGEVWPGASVFPDFSRAEVRSWWGNLYSKLLNIGVDAIWNDMNEPALSDFLTRDPQTESAIQSEAHKTMALTVMHRAGGDQPTGPDGPAVSHRFFHNAYGMEMARATYEGLSRLLPAARPFVLTRAGTAGVQRYAAVWTGDNDSTWEHLRLGIRMCLNLGMSGVPFVGVDIGGFWGTCDGELLVRFAQLGALLPFSRNHNALGNPDQEPWAFGEPYESAYRKAIELRYRLLPYLYTLFHQSSLDGSPIMRPLYYHFPQDELAHETQDEFLLGAALLSAPVSEPGAVSRSVYLPAGTWIDYWDGSEYPGEATIELAAPLDRWPLLVRGNSILPSGPLMQYTDERPTDPLTFSCYMTSDGQASFTLYEDDGNSQAYRSGAFALTTVSCRVENDLVTVRIDEQQNNYQPQRESYEINVYVGGRKLHRNVEAGRGSVTVRFA